MKTFGYRLRELRRAKDISQRELAEKVGVDFSYISKLENDRLPPPAADTILRICKILEASPDELLAATGKMPTHSKEMLGTSAAAQQFVRQAHEMDLSEDEWGALTKRLRRLRS
jgi:transcriptional regulator with XRE-family HTH domain